MNNVKNKCTKCKEKKDIPEFLNLKGKILKSCQECRNKNKKCPHNREKRKCKECGGSSICPHNRQKSICKECGGSSICIHNRQKSTCKECGGSGICPHNKIKSQCKECEGSSICLHNKRKSQCKECGGSSICIHNRIKNTCKECGGSSICPHNRIKSKCKECGGSEICSHNREKRTCKECGGSSICPHNKQKNKCKECGGSSICPHNKFKSRCKECGGSSLCKSDFCETIICTNKYNGYCLRCCVHLFPEIKVSRNYKVKEFDVVSRIQEAFSNYNWIYNKRIQDGCSGRLPDGILDMGSHVIMLEVDEYAHKNYECICENKRIMLLSQDLGHRPIVLIRFNPDGYINQDGLKIKSCWKMTKQGVMVIFKSKEWEERINTLKEEIQYWIDNETEKTIEIIELFY